MIEPQNSEGTISREKLLSDETFLHLFAIEDEIQQTKEKQRLTELADKAKCKTQFNELYRKWRKEYEEYRRSNDLGNPKPKTTNFSYPGLKTQLICEDYIADDYGIRYFNGKFEEMLADEPIFPLKLYVNVEKESQKVTLVYKTHNEWKEITVARDVLCNTRKMVNLGEYGVPVNTGNATKLSQYFSHLISRNSDKLEPILCTDKLGWIGEDFKNFAPYTGKLELDKDALSELSSTIEPKGSYDVWLENMREHRAKRRAELNFLLASSFASPLIKICNALPFWTHLWGFTGVGKTLCLMAAASIWGNPSTDANFLTNFKATTTSAEFRADMLNSLPILLDDTAQIARKNANDFSNLIYMLCSGQGKSRGNVNLNLSKQKNWTLSIVSTGEQPITNSDTQGGAMNRVIEIRTGNGEIFANGAYEADLLKNNYGHAGRVFIKAILDIGVGVIKEDYEIICKRLKEKMPKGLAKQIQSYALIMLADKIATEHVFCDGNYIDEDEFITSIKTEEEVDEATRAYEVLCNYVIENIKKFSEDERENWGKIEVVSPENDFRVYLLPKRFNDICNLICKLHPTVMMEYLRANKLLIENGSKDRKGWCVKKFGKLAVRTRAFTIKSENVDIDDVFDAFDGEIPFVT